VKRKGSDAQLLARRENSPADLKKQVGPLTRELTEAREAEQQLLSSVQFAILVQSIKDYAIYMPPSAGFAGAEEQEPGNSGFYAAARTKQ
jgi:hypothetical protein